MCVDNDKFDHLGDDGMWDVMHHQLPKVETRVTYLCSTTGVMTDQCDM